MMVCYSAYQGGEYFMKKNLADTFISHFRSTYEVYCFDCNSTLLIESDKVIWAGSVERGEYPNLNDCPYKGQTLYYREKAGGQRYFISDLYPGNQDIRFKAKSQTDVRPVLNAEKNNYFDPVLR